MPTVDWTPEFKSPPSSAFVCPGNVRVAEDEMWRAELRQCPGLEVRESSYGKALAQLQAFRPSPRLDGERILGGGDFGASKHPV